MSFEKINKESKNIIEKNKYPLISVMVPVYNVENYLEKCLDSIIDQTYQNLEIILVNDGSKDNSPKICDEYAKKDNRIKVIHKDNGGLSDARNVGLMHCKGDYLGFVDSDDWIKPNMYEKLLELCLKYEADIARCKSFTNEHEIFEEESQVTVLEKREFMPLILEDEISSHIWKNLYKKEAFRDIIFPKGYVAQDMMVFHKIANNANKIVETNEKLYY